NQQQNECDDKSRGVQHRRIEKVPEQRREKERCVRKRQNERQSADRDDDLEKAVEPQRLLPSAEKSRREHVADAESCHEAGEDDCRCPRAIAEDQAAIAEPERLEKQRSCARQEKD